MAKKYFEFGFTSHYIRTHKDYIVKSGTANDELFKSEYLMDTIRLAKVLDKKVNLNWSVKRLKSEHDKFSKVLNDIIFINDDKPLNNHKIFVKFGESSGLELINSTKDLALEGIRQSHCVGSYASKINSGYSGIFRVQDHTLELGFKIDAKTDGLFIKQLRGFNNNKAPINVKEAVLDLINNFNSKLSEEDLKEIETTFKPQSYGHLDGVEIFEEDLPF
jgi:hypothetical protein